MWRTTRRWHRWPSSSWSARWKPPGKLLTIEALTAAYLLAEAQAAESGGSESAAQARPLGKGTGAVVDRLSVLLADQLPAAALVERGRDALRELLAGLPELRRPPPGDDDDTGGEA